ncbi:FKBP-type peptidyl-prolyl cis-trans isomerase [uncultured Halopseudomonas sp.]|jgi:FKBP-type peptidyl-prolyl cis-trans isomerase FklB|uniref:FKBP-type peptidyl-prolyl cis-trans isomerase n=1 Tax=uncultured Halopseudomonas sp. TaxID=2901193 RepID=UPI0030EB4A67|tara:strand:- start:13925 stop:14644 length:720 start_codon:yes stop_codon:yes gene_type:complete
MKRNLLAASIALSIFALAGCEKEPELSDPIQQASYGIGLNMGESLMNDGLDDIDPEALALGMKDALAGEESRVADEDLTAAFEALQTRAQERAASLGEEAAQANVDFLAENAQVEGVVTTDSGLQYQILEEGDGEATPGPDDVVTVHYEGRLLDGTVFDSSVSRGEPVDLPVSGVIPGWVEILQLMNVGDKFKVTIPSELAYGEASPSPVIPPNSILVFEMELLGIQSDEQSEEPTDGE